MPVQDNVERIILKKVTPFFVLGDLQNRIEIARENINVRIHCRNMGNTYFILGLKNKMCKTKSTNL